MVAQNPSMPTESRGVLARARKVSMSFSISLLILAVGGAASCAFALMAAKAPGVYWTDVEVHFLIPQSAANPNVLEVSSTGAVILAGAVEKMVDNQVTPRVIDPDNNLASQGIRHGYAVSIPNTGGQWASNFTSPWLEVQAVGNSPGEVMSQTDTLIKEINLALAHLQQQRHVDQYNLIHTELSPPSGPNLNYEGGSRMRATGSALALGAALTSACYSYSRRDPWYPRRRKNRAVAVPEPARRFAVGSPRSPRG